MPSGEQQEPKLPLQNVMLLAGAVAGALWLYQGPLKSSRPIEELQKQEVIADRRVQARLWQDPFAAVEAHLLIEELLSKRTHDEGKSPHQHTLKDLAKEMAASKLAQVHILVLLTDGAPYADPSESRLRQRYALLAGLDRAGYVPRDGEHLRFFQWDSPRDSVNPPYAYWRAAAVPVEWYQSSDNPTAQVLALWIKDQDLGDSPLSSLRAIQTEVLAALAVPKRNVSFKMIGPRFSGTLHNMVVEAKTSSAASANAPHYGGSQTPTLEIYSPWSTAPEVFITGSTKEKPTPELSQILEKASVAFFRAVPTDDLLIGELVEELGKRRGIKMGPACTRDESCDRVAIVSEWDTLYGRALPEIFQETTSAGEEARWIRRFSYLRGLDGELPREKGKTGTGDSSQEDDKATLSRKDRRKQIEQLERPEGRSQFDYVRRLAQSMKDDEEQLRSGCSLLKGDCADFKAIGVLGSDVYDKLLILQALKQLFPQAIFFTTDLDVRLFHTSELRWTRNLVVASSFGLALHDSLQEGIPPFRDTYQTSTFYAVLRALDALQETGSCRSECYGPFLERYSYRKPGSGKAMFFEVNWRPRLHEIGQNGPVDLSIAADASIQNPDIRSIHQLRPSPVSVTTARRHVMLFVAALAIGWILLIPASQTVYRMTHHACRVVTTRSFLAIGSIGVLVIIGTSVFLVAIPYLVSDGDKGEPFSMFDGISIWPSQILRGLVVVLAIMFIWRIKSRLRAMRREVEQDFVQLLHGASPENGSADQPLESQNGASFRMRIARWCMSDRLRSVSGWALDRVPKEPSHLWAEYKKRMAWPYLIVRVVAWSAIFLFIGTVVMGICGRPLSPFRGAVSQHVNEILIRAAVLGMVLVIFVVLDVTRLTGAFVRKLVSKELGAVDPEGSLMKLQLIARLTARIDHFIYYPAVLMALMLSARAHYLDNWDFPVGLMIVVGLSAVYVVASAVMLRSAAEEARRLLLHDLSERQLTGLEPKTHQYLTQIKDRIAALREGAFRPYTELPVFRGVALPSGAYGVVALIEFLADTF